MGYGPHPIRQTIASIAAAAYPIRQDLAPCAGQMNPIRQGNAGYAPACPRNNQAHHSTLYVVDG